MPGCETHVWYVVDVIDNTERQLDVCLEMFRYRNVIMKSSEEGSDMLGESWNNIYRVVANQCL